MTDSEEQGRLVKALLARREALGDRDPLARLRRIIAAKVAAGEEIAENRESK